MPDNPGVGQWEPGPRPGRDSARPFPPWGLYLSIPFCRFKCTYCNFASGVFARADLDRYLEAIAAEVGAAGGRLARMPGNGQSVAPLADTAYLGGGTPSMLAPEQIRSLFGAVQRAFEFTPGSEVTLEAAPGSISTELANAWTAVGINRLSLGVQSFVIEELKAVGRPHRAETVEHDVALLRDHDIHSINIDLIAGLPYQTAATWETTLDWVARLRPEHVSVYIFEVDEDSRLGSEVLAGGRRYSAGLLPGEDATADFYCRAIERLRELGYGQYEISNFALPGCESRHNLKYWQGDPYVGFGVDAHSYDGHERWANTDSLEEYLKAAAEGRTPVTVRHSLDDIRRAEERLFLGLRQNRGVELRVSEYERYGGEIDKMAQAGLLEWAGGRLRLTDRGRLLSNEVFALFIE